MIVVSSPVYACTTITAIAPYAACYKPNVAFFEALGVNGGISTLKRVIDCIPDDIPVLLDVKRGDIGSTAAAYATACYDHLNADAVTLSPLMGWDSVEPFVTGKKTVHGLCRSEYATFTLDYHSHTVSTEHQAIIVTREHFSCAKLPILDPMTCWP